MTSTLQLARLRDIAPPQWDPADEWEAQMENAHEIAATMAVPLQRAMDAWNTRITESEPLVGKEKGDLNDRIEDEIWLLHRHGYSVLRTSGPNHRQSAHVSVQPGAVRSAAFEYRVYSLNDLADPWKASAPYPTTGGEHPGAFEQARDHADAVCGVVLEWRRWSPDDDVSDRLRCVYLSPAITPKNAYEAFMEMSDDGTVISRFIPVFERMLLREHRAVEAISDRDLRHYQALGEIAFCLGEVRSWKADRDWLLAQGKI